MARFRVLGTVAVEADGIPVDIGPASRRALLAVLLVEAGRVVSVDQLINRLWTESPPRRARENLYSYLSRLRAVLGDGIVDRRSGGYVLTVDPMRVDMHRFRNLVIQARQSTHDDESAELFESALELWRGEPFEDLDVPWLHAVANGLAAERLAAELDRNDVQLRRGQHSRLLAALRERADDHPLDERLAGQLMTALYRSGRQSEALERFRDLRSLLVRELGGEPGPELSRLHRRILNRDTALELTTPVVEPTRPRTPIPRQLPARPGGFVGRDTELEFLDAVLDEDCRLAVLAGAGGMGKTWLTMHWGQSRLDRFPDGQLYVNLRGFDPSEQPMDPELAIRDLLAAMGIHSRSMPTGLDAQSGLFRSLLADKRALVVLDNARDTRQVLPLLPGGTRTMTIVTSRSDLTGLVTAHGARHLNLRPFNDRDAYETLTRRVGRARITAEPEAADELLAHCAGLPLALGILGVRAALWPELPLKTLTAELRRARLDTLDTGELSASVRAVLAGSIAVLSPEAARLLLLLGTAPGDDIASHAVASVAAVPVTVALNLLRELESAHLIEQPTPGRYRMHDLTKLYAVERAIEDIPRVEREDGLRRLIDHYLHTAFLGERVLSPYRTPIELDAPLPGSVRPELDDDDDAHRWFDTELSNLIAVQQRAAENRWDAVTWRLAWSMDTYLYSRALVHLSVDFWRIAVDGATHLSDPAIEILCHRRLAGGLAFGQPAEEATRHYLRALELCETIGDREQQGHIHRGLTILHIKWSEFAKAVDHGERALALYREIGPVRIEAAALNNLSFSHLKLGHHERAQEYAESALDISRRRNDTSLLGYIHSTLGDIAQSRGRHETALEQYRLSLRHFAATEELDRVGVVESIGDVLRDLGRMAEARDHWLQALEVLRAQQRDERAESLETKLSIWGDPTPSP
ncbi:BTAD domain-containing putative transcriptional regulator [Stackebrandtia soli]|uniref:AfsR/SARP family transcriptional regulator n=1 Tax=Stackebrandtia soli TaxID=1892856 RepID=UPI0039EB0502